MANPRTLTFSVDDELRHRLDSEAVRTGLSVSSIIRLRLNASYGLSEIIVPPKLPRQMTFTGGGGSLRVLMGEGEVREVVRKRKSKTKA